MKYEFYHMLHGETMIAKNKHRNPEAKDNNDFNKGDDACFCYKASTEIWQYR